MEVTQEHITLYHYLGMSPREISVTLGVPLQRVYRNINYTDMGRRTFHYFPDMDTSTPQLVNAEHNRQLNAEQHHMRTSNGTL